MSNAIIVMAGGISTILTKNRAEKSPFLVLLVIILGLFDVCNVGVKEL